MLKTAFWLGAALVFAGTCALPALADEANAPDKDGPMRHARPVFSDIDTNKDGVISQAELDAFYAQKMQGGDHWHGREHKWRRDGMRPHHGHPFHGPDLERLDTNKDGKISLEEFLDPMKARFARMDTNKDGFLDETELKAPPPPPQGRPWGDAPPPPAKK